MRLATIVGTALSMMLCFSQTLLACKRLSPVSATEMIRGADAIVRVLAKEYVTPPANASMRTTGVPDSRIVFEVLEVIRGQGLESQIILPGYLSNEDDFNDQASPYSFVRPNGRSGSCFANTYRSGAQFLLVLKKVTDGDYTVNWYALGPVNEQLRSENDPWLLWVRQEAQRGVRPDPALEPAARGHLAKHRRNLERLKPPVTPSFFG
jgi:hypothetical protein